MCLNPTLLVNPRIVSFFKVSRRGGYLEDLSSSDDPISVYSLKYLYGLRSELSKDISSYDDVVRRYKFYPFFGTDPLPAFILCNCGKCPDCLKASSSNLYHRLLLEAASYPDEVPIFFTLTYRDESIPQAFCFNEDGHGDIDDVFMTDYSWTSVKARRDITLFLKRLRQNLKRYGYVDKFRYFITSEHGSLHNRLHFHGLIFGHGLSLDVLRDSLTLDSLKHLFDVSWGYGFVHVSFLKSAKALRYTSKYLFKSKFFHSDDIRSFSNRNGGLGCPYFLLHPITFDSVVNNEYRVDISFLGRNFSVVLPKQIITYFLPNVSRRLPRIVPLLWSVLSANYTYGFLSQSDLDRLDVYHKIFPFIPDRYFLSRSDLPDSFRHNLKNDKFCHEYLVISDILLSFASEIVNIPFAESFYKARSEFFSALDYDVSLFSPYEYIHKHIYSIDLQ